MAVNKLEIQNKLEWILLFAVYMSLVFSLMYMHDSYAAAISAFFGITYTFLAGKGKPICYLFGITGSGFYVWLAYNNSLWGNLLLYAAYYIPMQAIGFIKWNSHLKEDKSGVVKISLALKEKIVLFSITFAVSILTSILLYYFGDKNPIADGLTTIFSILGMYLTVRRAREQWVVWIFVNILSAIMWGIIACSGVKVYSTVIMWIVYVVLAIYFHFTWKKELSI